MSATDWLTLYEQTDQTLNTLAHDVREHQSKTSTASVREKRVAHTKLRSAKDDIATLERSLNRMETNPSDFNIGAGEVVRRRGLLTELKNLFTSVEDGATNSKTRRDLFTGAGDKRGRVEEGDETKHLDNTQIHSQQQDLLQKQDEQLGTVLEGVTKLKVMSHDISTELDLHKHLLDEVDQSVDRTDGKIRKNIDRVDIIQKEEGGGCCALIVMVLLLVLIIFLASSNYACHIFKPSKC